MDHAIDQTPAPHDSRLRAIELLLSRRSTNLLQEPAPEGAELDLILDAGLRAPDHGRLKPWRFVLIRGDQRLAWADRVAEIILARDPANGQMLAERYRAWVWRTPLIIALGAEVRADHSIPEIEQVLSVGAAAMNMLNAVHMLSYGGMWVTGLNSYDPQVNKLLGFEAPNRLVGFLAVGTPKPPPKSAPQAVRAARAEHTREWIG